MRYQNPILVARLRDLPEKVEVVENALENKKKMQSSIRKIHETYKIRHVKNLLPRIANYAPTDSCGQFQDDANFLTRRNLAGNPLLMTHQSHIKNLNMYFRTKNKKLTGTYTPLYTIENSSKNWVILKEMLRNILLEMRAFKKINL